MAFKKENYPVNWKDTIRPAALKKAGYKCQSCGLPNKIQGFYDHDNRFVELDRITEAYGKNHNFKIITIHLAVSHQNHDTTDNRPSNLKVRCQRCHLSHDKELHKLSRNCKKSTIQLAPYSSIPDPCFIRARIN